MVLFILERKRQKCSKLMVLPERLSTSIRLTEVIKQQKRFKLATKIYFSFRENSPILDQPLQRKVHHGILQRTCMPLLFHSASSFADLTCFSTTCANSYRPLPAAAATPLPVRVAMGTDGTVCRTDEDGKFVLWSARLPVPAITAIYFTNCEECWDNNVFNVCNYTYFIDHRHGQ